MRAIKIILFAGVCSLISNIIYAQSSDSSVIRSFYSEALANGKAYDWLDTLSNKIGGRLTGSPQAALAVEWAKRTMETIPGVKVTLQECMVPHWVRGDQERGYIITEGGNKKTEVPVCALGGSIGTGKNGVQGHVVEIKSFDELAKLGRKGIEGKIVFYNRPMDATKIFTFQAYGDAVGQRYAGAMEAAKYGAVGTICRSMTTRIDDNPHTGSMGYSDTIVKIPSCAISTKGAELLNAMLIANADLSFYFKMDCETLPDVKSYNVVGEIKGTEHPEEIIVVGGHLDSWDTGKGATDDGAGVVQSMEVLNLFKTLGIKPKRTIRAVAFMNEENGLRGGKKYAELARQNNEKHIIAIESDRGGFTPRGFAMDGDSLKLIRIRNWKKLFRDYGLHDWEQGGGGADTSPLIEQGVVQMELAPDSQRYFDYHHTAIDIFENVNPRELELGAASMAGLIYLLSEYGLE